MTNYQHRLNPFVFIFTLCLYLAIPNLSSAILLDPMDLTKGEIAKLIPVCGNGITEEGEECDDGDDSNTDLCLNDCKRSVCGDGFVYLDTGLRTKIPYEQCDDGNQDNTDGCAVDCKIETCNEPDEKYNLQTRQCDNICEDGSAAVVAYCNVNKDTQGVECFDGADVLIPLELQVPPVNYFSNDSDQLATVHLINNQIGVTTSLLEKDKSIRFVTYAPDIEISGISFADDMVFVISKEAFVYKLDLNALVQVADLSSYVDPDLLGDPRLSSGDGALVVSVSGQNYNIDLNDFKVTIREAVVRLAPLLTKTVKLAPVLSKEPLEPVRLYVNDALQICPDLIVRVERPDCEKDRSCDNIINNGCEEGEVQIIKALGVCESGEQVCVNGRWSVIQEVTQGTAEECNGLDDDCNGLIDDGVSNACGTCGDLPADCHVDGDDQDCDGQDGNDSETEACGGVETNEQKVPGVTELNENPEFEVDPQEIAPMVAMKAVGGCSLGVYTSSNASPLLSLFLCLFSLFGVRMKTDDDSK